MTLAERITRETEDVLYWRWDVLHRTRSPTAFDENRFLLMIREITAPVTVVVGSKSWYGGFDFGKREAVLNVVRRVTLETGHNPHVEMPVDLARIIEEAAEAWT